MEFTQPKSPALARLEYLHVALLQADSFSAQLLRKTLSSIGIAHTSLTRDSREIFDIITAKPADLLIAEWDSKPENSIDITRQLRAPESVNRLLPIILTTSRSEKADLDLARDAGVNEIVVKPFTMKALQNVVTSIIDTPRAFIISRNYAGPDRRRNDEPLPEGIMERRGVDTELGEPVIIDRQSASEVFLDEHPRLIPPDYGMRQRLELSLLKGNTIEIAHAEEAPPPVDHFAVMLGETAEIRECYRQLTASPEDADELIEALRKSTLTIRSHAITSHYVFAARVATALHDFCKRYLNTQNPQHLLIVGKHIDTLHAVLQQRIVGDEDEVGRALVKELKRLVYVYTLPPKQVSVPPAARGAAPPPSNP